MENVLSLGNEIKRHSTGRGHRGRAGAANAYPFAVAFAVPFVSHLCLVTGAVLLCLVPKVAVPQKAHRHRELFMSQTLARLLVLKI